MYLLLLSSWLSIGWAYLFSGTTTSVWIVPQEITLVVGEKATVSVDIETIDEFFGFEIHIQFDANKVQVLDGDSSLPGIQLLAGDIFEVSEGFLVVNQVDNDLGTAVYAYTLLAPASPISGDGSLVAFELQAIAEGRSNLELIEIIIASPDGQPLPFISHDGEVVVQGVGTDTPVSTPASVVTPSVTPTPHSPTITVVSPSVTSTPYSTQTLASSATSTDLSTMTATQLPLSTVVQHSPSPSSTQEFIANETSTSVETPVPDPTTDVPTQTTYLTPASSESQSVAETQVKLAMSGTLAATEPTLVVTKGSTQTNSQSRQFRPVALVALIVFMISGAVLLIRRVFYRG